MTHTAPAKLADQAAEAVRSLNHATLPHQTALTHPGQASSVIGNLKALAERLPQSCDQTRAFLELLHQQGALRSTAGDPAQAVATAEMALQDAASAAQAMAQALSEAHSVIAALYVPDTDQN